MISHSCSYVLWAPQCHLQVYFLASLMLEFESFSYIDTIYVIMPGATSHYLEVNTEHSMLEVLHQQCENLVPPVQCSFAY